MLGNLMIFEGTLEQVQRAIILVVKHIVHELIHRYTQLASRVTLSDLEATAAVVLEKTLQLPLAEGRPLGSDSLNYHRSAPSLIFL